MALPNGSESKIKIGQPDLETTVPKLTGLGGANTQDLTAYIRNSLLIPPMSEEKGLEITSVVLVNKNREIVESFAVVSGKDIKNLSESDLDNIKNGVIGLENGVERNDLGGATKVELKNVEKSMTPQGIVEQININLENNRNLKNQWNKEPITGVVLTQSDVEKLLRDKKLQYAKH